jgi:hypothetical protein
LKTVEIPTPYLFFFLESSSIWLYASHNGIVVPSPHKQKVSQYLKNYWDPRH